MWDSSTIPLVRDRNLVVIFSKWKQTSLCQQESVCITLTLFSPLVQCIVVGYPLPNCCDVVKLLCEAHSLEYSAHSIACTLLYSARGCVTLFLQLTCGWGNPSSCPPGHIYTWGICFTTTPAPGLHLLSLTKAQCSTYWALLGTAYYYSSVHSSEVQRSAVQSKVVFL